jgi:asparagine synthase
MLEVVDHLYYPNYPSTSLPTNGLPKLDTGLKFACAVNEAGRLTLSRDPIGLNKLFYSVKGSKLYLASKLSSLIEDNLSLENIFSVPPGAKLTLGSDGQLEQYEFYQDLSDTIALDTFCDRTFEANFKKSMDKTFGLIQDNYPNHKIFVCLSGGLDSTLIAYLSKTYLKSVEAITFSFNEAHNFPNYSDDYNSARSIAEHLKLDFHSVICEKYIDKSLIDELVKLSQDYRDFNVHCAYVNYKLGEYARNAFPDDKILFLTGDLMNEYVADYTPVTYSDTVYYKQPRIPKWRLRNFYIYGLGTSDREIGVFNNFGIDTIQPYAGVVREYLGLPTSMLERTDLKEFLNLRFIQDLELKKLITKEKTRAQVGGKDGGVLGLFHDEGIGSEKLLSSFADIFAGGNIELAKNFIVAGRYKTEL